MAWLAVPLHKDDLSMPHQQWEEGDKSQLWVCGVQSGGVAGTLCCSSGVVAHGMESEEALLSSGTRVELVAWGWWQLAEAEGPGPLLQP